MISLVRALVAMAPGVVVDRRARKGDDGAVELVSWAVVVFAWAWVAVCLVGVLGVVLGLLAHYVGLVEEWLRPQAQRLAAARRRS